MKLFENTETAFKLMSNSELDRAYFLFKMIQSPTLVSIGTSLANFSIKTHLPVEGLIRSTVFDHFCGGTTVEDSIPVIEKMYSEGVSSVLDYSVEGKEDDATFDNVTEKILHIIEMAKERESIPFAVFKPTGFGRFYIYEKVSKNEELTDSENDEWKKIKNRYDKVCKKAYELNVPILIDAEESWMQDAADDLAEEMMMKYNTEKPLIFNTLQMYRHDRMDYLKALHRRATIEGFHIGMKVVRGAYMEKERERAKEKGYQSPICIDKKATDENYNTAITYMVEHKMGLFAGTHNEHSAFLLTTLIEKFNHDKKYQNIWFGQLLGMSDHISFNLSNIGYNVAKYVPFGPVRDVIPYLIRRAEENTSIEGQTSRELNLLSTEKQRRKENNPK